VQTKSSKKIPSKKERVQTKRGLKNRKVQTKSFKKYQLKTGKNTKTRSNIKMVKNNQQKEDSRRKMKEYNSNIVFTNHRIKGDRLPICVCGQPLRYY